MRILTIRSALLAAASVLALTGCAQTRQVTPAAAQIQYQLHGLPSNVVEVQVNDLRGAADVRDSMPKILKAQIVGALSPQPAADDGRRYQLAIDVVEYRTFFTFGNWNSATRLRARLSDAAGQMLGQWDAAGNGHRSNLYGHLSADAAAQDSYKVAVADLLSALNGVSVRDRQSAQRQ